MLFSLYVANAPAISGFHAPVVLPRHLYCIHWNSDSIKTKHRFSYLCHIINVNIWWYFDYLK